MVVYASGFRGVEMERQWRYKSQEFLKNKSFHVKPRRRLSKLAEGAFTIEVVTLFQNVTARMKKEVFL